jgi:hypothetical protein
MVCIAIFQPVENIINKIQPEHLKIVFSDIKIVSIVGIYS